MKVRNPLSTVLGLVGIYLVMLMLPTVILAAEGLSGGGGSGDVFGDLIHIKRHAVTGQPILQKRWIEDKDSYTWGYCPIPLDATGAEIGFAAYSCDPENLTAVVEVDYFGRLNAGRTKERNSRMHFNEVIGNIKMAGKVKQDESGRLKLGYGCVTKEKNTVCSDWVTIDSPMENMALYTRLMKYGHLQTDPAEVDIWAHGDPAQGIQYHPALGPEDWVKFHSSVKHLLPAQTCFDGGGFNQNCKNPETLSAEDFTRAGSFLAGGANKDGKITADLVQYLNRILKIAVNTETTAATPAVLPALIRDCGDDPQNQLPTEQCAIVPAIAGLPAPADEKFVDFGAAAYLRNDWRDETLEVILPAAAGLWQTRTDVSLLGWLEFRNGPAATMQSNIQGFTSASSDALRAIEFMHNYEIPADLGWSGF